MMLRDLTHIRIKYILTDPSKESIAYIMNSAEMDFEYEDGSIHKRKITIHAETAEELELLSEGIKETIMLMRDSL